MIVNIITNDDRLKNGIKQICDQLDNKYNLSDIIIIPNINDSFDKISVEKNGNSVTITCKKIHEFYMGFSVLVSKLNEKSFSISWKNSFKKTGVMLDNARNASLNIKSVKKFIANMAMLGYSYIELYVEDVMEVDNEPFFGYMRGKFYKKDFKEIDSFCQNLGIELIPCIQTLAHLNQIWWHWSEYTGVIKDINDILLVREPRTYVLIENIIKTCSECFSSKKINIGMDEAFMLGKGEYLKRFGEETQTEIMKYHVARILEICDKYNFEPKMWADMYKTFANEIGVENVHVPDKVELIEWNYSFTTEKEYIEHIQLAESLTKNISFAGTINRITGFTPNNTFTQVVMTPAIEACKKEKISNFLVTMWGDEGAECSAFAVLYSLINMSKLFIEESCRNVIDWDNLANVLTGYNMEELRSLDLPNKIFEREVDILTNPSKYLFYEDALMGLSELQARDNYPEYYQKNAQVLKKLSERQSSYSYLFKTMYTLCDFLEIKSTLLLKIRRAYAEKDNNQLSIIANEIIPLALKRLDNFYVAYENQWYNDNKPFGFEISDVRIGGLIQRLKHIAIVLNRYIRNDISVIPELEEKVLLAKEANENYNGSGLFNGYISNFTYCKI